jgi:Heparinase II/III-like protein
LPSEARQKLYIQPVGPDAVLRRALVGALIAMAVVAAWSLTRAPDAHAASPLEVLALKLQPCPTYEVGRMRDDYSAAELAAAKQGDFDVFGGLRTHLEPPVDWAQDPYADRSWVHYLHGFLWLDQLLRSYVADDDLSALADARDLLVDWVAAVRPGDPDYPDEAWGDKTTGDRAGYLAFVTRAAACRGLLTDSQASALIDAAREHATTLANPAGYVPNNHGLFVDIGLARLALHMGFLNDAAGWDGLARGRFASTLDGRLAGDEGLWLEHSAGYQFTVMRLVEKFERVIGDPEAFTPELAQMTEAAGWLVLPSGRLFPWGDSRSGGVAGWAVDEGADDEGLHAFMASGLAVVKGDGAYLAVTSSFHNRTHKHADELGFHLYDRGRDVISDSGFSDYNIDKWQFFSRSAQAHSVLTLRDRGFPVGEEKYAYGSGLVATGEGDGWYAIEGRNPLLGKWGVHHHRLFLYRPGRALLVLDRVRSRHSRVYVRRFQVAAGIRAARRGSKVRLRGGGVNAALVGGRGRANLVKGHYSPPAGWSFPAAGERVPRWTVGYRSRAERARYVTAIGLRGAARAHVLKSRKHQLRLRVGGSTLARGATVSVRRAGDRLLVNRERATRRHGGRAR